MLANKFVTFYKVTGYHMLRSLNFDKKNSTMRFSCHFAKGRHFSLHWQAYTYAGLALHCKHSGHSVSQITRGRDLWGYLPRQRDKEALCHMALNSGLILTTRLSVTLAFQTMMTTVLLKDKDNKRKDKCNNKVEY